MSSYRNAYDPRWIRHDAHLWIQPNIERFMLPGVDPADVIPAPAQKRAQEEAARARQDAAFHAEIDAELEYERRVLAAMRVELNEIKAELARRRRLAEQTKYSPSQPRMPAGNPRGGQWTDRGGGQSTGTGLAQPMGNIDIGDLSGSSELTGLFDIRPAATGSDSANSSHSVLKVATDESGRRYSVNLQEEEARGGHTLRDHVGKTDGYLIGLMNADYERSTSGNLEITRFRDAEGSFATHAEANDYVNQLLKLERDKVDQFVAAPEPWLTLERRIGSVTGKEAFRPNGDSDPYIRDTYGVRAVIIPDKRAARLYGPHGVSGQ
jgi:hypothetical protein